MRRRFLSNGKPPTIRVTKWAESYKIVDWVGEAKLAAIWAKAAPKKMSEVQQICRQLHRSWSSVPRQGSVKRRRTRVERACLLTVTDSQVPRRLNECAATDAT